ncbi:hypothetical protein [Mangrovimonas sp. YM274]|uniref:hypothetical protein n=1 Tax=Mangrovimonas sp. YM274 TaxID=3070660 RepID=UPI0027DE8B68|nr:hypothetical protein [Mangrovimonas sp. YM274]WMI68150.1 hypothetical protein RBH95_13470 [Mangrovimonas sp. YM274]
MLIPINGKKCRMMVRFLGLFINDIINKYTTGPYTKEKLDGKVKYDGFVNKKINFIEK